MNQDQTPTKPASSDKPTIAPVTQAPAQPEIRVEPKVVPVTAPAAKA